MKKFTNIKDGIWPDEELPKEFREAVGEENIDKSFEETLGGDVFIIETPDDLAEIYALDNENERVDIRKKVTTFDSAHYFPSKNWMLFFTATNDQGGPCYIVPAKIGRAYITLDEAIRLTNEPYNQNPVRSFRGQLTRVTRVSPISGTIHERYIPYSKEDFDNYISGMNIAEAFPKLTVEERNFVLIGFTGEESELIFPDDSE
jgi:hypothetical protein